MKLKDRIKKWTITHAKGPQGKFWLALFSFTESSFFPIPPDFIMIAVLLARQRHRWFFYALLTTIFSVLGGLFGYLIGFVFFEAIGTSIVSFYNLETQMETISAFFSQNAFFTVFLAAFTPIPYKVFTIGSGLFKINLLTFVVASILGRGIRFFAVAYFIKLYGKRISKVIYKYFNAFSLLVILFIILFIYLLF